MNPNACKRRVSSLRADLECVDGAGGPDVVVDEGIKPGGTSNEYDFTGEGDDSCSLGMETALI